MPFCGHAIIATAVEIARRVGAGTLAVTTRAGAVLVQTVIQDGSPWATLTSVPARSRPVSQDQAGLALAALRWAPADLDSRFPVHVAFAGAYHLMLAAATRARLAGLDYDFAAAAAFGGYLRALGRITAPTRLTLRQGEDLGGPSGLLVDVDPASERVKVTLVRGRADR